MSGPWPDCRCFHGEKRTRNCAILDDIARRHTRNLANALDEHNMCAEVLPHVAGLVGYLLLTCQIFQTGDVDEVREQLLRDIDNMTRTASAHMEQKYHEVKGSTRQ